MNSTELKKCSRCHSKIMLVYYSKNRQNEYFKTCNNCRNYNKKACKIYHKNNREKHNAHKKLNKNQNPISTIISNCKGSDKRANRFFDLDKEFIECILDLQQYSCFHCNSPLQMTNGNNYNRKQFSLDRLNNKLGHTRSGLDGYSNVVASCWGCNSKRGSKLINDFTPSPQFNILPGNMGNLTI